MKTNMNNALRCLLFLAILVHWTSNVNAQEGYGETGGGNESPVINETGIGADKGAAETPSIEPARDGIYDRTIAQERQALAYDHIREADVFWQKRIWRVIDTRQKINQSFTNPQEPFIQILLDVAEQNQGDVRLYMDDTFTEGVTMSEVMQSLGSIDTITRINFDTYEEEQVVVQNEFNWETVSKFRIKEDWVFDEETSRMVVRILGIAPIMDVFDDNDNYRGQRAMFWAYYPDLRQHLVKEEVFNPKNDGIKMSWDDLFEMRYFHSFIMKEANIQDRRISDYSDGRDALFESERIKNEIFEYEHNLWSY